MKGQQASNYIAPDDERITAYIYKAPIEFIFGSDSYTKEYDGTSSFFNAVSDAYIQITTSENTRAHRIEGTNYYRRGDTNEIYKIELDAVDSSEDHNICYNAINDDDNYYNIRLKLTPGLLRNGEPEFYDDPSDFSQFYSNYDCPILTETFLSAPTFKIAPKTLTIGSDTPTTVSKTYDGKTLSSTNATITLGDVTGFLDDDENKIDILYTIVGDFIDINRLNGNVGTYNVSVHYEVSPKSPRYQTVANNYTVTPNGQVTATINRKSLTISDLSADKFYDGTNKATIVIGSVDGIIDGDDVEVYVSNNDSATYSGSSVGTYIVSATYGTRGADANNYTLNLSDLSVIHVQGTISPAKITSIPTDIVDGFPTYNGETTINSFINEYSLTFDSGEEITVVPLDDDHSNLYVEEGSNENNHNRRVFKIDCFTVDENNNRMSDIGSYNKYESYAVLGTYSNESNQFIPDSSGNYEFVSTYYSGEPIRRIAALIYITTNSLDKQWDGSIKAYPTFTYFGVVGDDDVVIDIATTDFESSEIGTETVITVTYSLSGSKAYNYKISGSNTETLTAEISKRIVTISEPYALYE